MSASLLSAPASNAKLAKSQGYGFLPYGLSLAPYNLSGHNVCPQSTPGCRPPICVATTGQAQVFKSIMQARIEKTKRLFDSRDDFLTQLVGEIARAHKKAEEQNLQLALRLNVFSDLDWRAKRHSAGWSVFDWLDELPGVVAYDYTKVTRRAVRELETDSRTKWNIVYSRSERNERECLDYLNRGGKVSVVFDCRKHELPTSWNGFPVVDGDVHDLHFLHAAGTVVGLAAKGTARGAAGGFVVEGGRE
jgi:hypothetical protein